MPDTPMRPRSTWDLALTVVLLVVAAIAAVVLGYLGVFVGFVSDPCDARCSYGVIGTGVGIAVVGPGVVTFAATVAAVVALVRRRLALWIVLVALAAEVGALLAGYAVAASGVHT